MHYNFCSHFFAPQVLFTSLSYQRAFGNIYQTETIVIILDNQTFTKVKAKKQFILIDLSIGGRLFQEFATKKQILKSLNQFCIKKTIFNKKNLLQRYFVSYYH